VEYLAELAAGLSAQVGQVERILANLRAQINEAKFMEISEVGRKPALAVANARAPEADRRS
jgi:hypothetical protein